MSLYTAELGPGQKRSFECGKSDFFAVVFAPSEVEIALPGSEFSIFQQGDSRESRTGVFDHIEVRNPSATSTLKVTIYAGLDRYGQQRQAVIEPKTRMIAHAVHTIASGGTITFTGVPTGALIRRKAFEISNNDATTQYLELLDDADEAGLRVKAGQSITVPVSEVIKIHNPNAGAVSFDASEIWWTL